MMRWNRSTLLGAAACALIALPAGAQAFSDDFESYNLNQGLVVQNPGEYEEWCGSQNVDWTVVNTQAFSGTKSIMAEAADDVIHRINATSGVWTVSVQVYLPNSLTGRGFLILMNTYLDQNCANGNWSSQISFDAGLGIISELDGGPTNEVDLVFDAWREIRVVIDLDNDLYNAFYEDIDGIFQPIVVDQPWSDDGVSELEVIDMFSDTATGYFWDDLSIVGEGGGGELAQLTSLLIIDGFPVSGGVPELEASDDTYFSTLALETGKASATHRLLYLARALTTVQNPTTIDITLEGHILDLNVLGTLFLRNFDTGLYEEVGQFTQAFGADTTTTINVPNASRFVRPANGRILLRVRKVVILPITVGEGFPSKDDLLEIRVQ